MSRSRAPELLAAQKKIMATAKKIADRQAREELLADDGEFSLVRRLALAQATTVPVLRGSWKPYYIDKAADSGFGFKLRADDRLVIEILADMGLLDRVNEIGTEAVVASIMNSHQQEFISTLLNDLIQVDSFYEEESHDAASA